MTRRIRLYRVTYTNGTSRALYAYSLTDAREQGNLAAVAWAGEVATVTAGEARRHNDGTVCHGLDH